MHDGGYVTDYKDYKIGIDCTSTACQTAVSGIWIHNFCNLEHCPKQPDPQNDNRLHSKNKCWINAYRRTCVPEAGIKDKDK